MFCNKTLATVRFFYSQIIPHHSRGCVLERKLKIGKDVLSSFASIQLLEMKRDLIVHVIHIAGSQMMVQGMDGILRGGTDPWE